MSRIPAVAPRDASLLVKTAYWITRRRFGVVPEPFAVLAHHRKLFMAASRHELALEKATHVSSPSLIQLAVYRVAWTIGCSWCVDFGTMLQRLDGLDIDRLRDIDSFETSEAFTAAEREIIRYADAMTATPMTVTDQQVADLVEVYGHAGVIELTYQISHENQRGRMYHAFGIVDQGFSSGDACRVPWLTESEASPPA